MLIFLSILIFTSIGWLLRNELCYIASFMWCAVLIYCVADRLVLQTNLAGQLDKLLLMTIPLIFSLLASISAILTIRPILRRQQLVNHILTRFKQTD